MPQPAGGWPHRRLAHADLALLAGLLLLALPALHALWVGAWSTAQGAQGPIVLGSGLWLILRETGAREKGGALSGARMVLMWPLLGVLLVAYVLALMTGVLALAWATLVAIGAFALFAVAGWPALSARWFAFLYLIFAAPVPTRLAGSLADALSVWLSRAAVEILWLCGIDAASSGLDLYVDQYELRMADACAGLNSLTSLFAIGLFYIFVRHRSRWRHALALCVFVPPIAVLSNLARIVILLLVTHVWGDEVAQGILHRGTGIVMFVVALATLLAVDALLSRLVRS
ncbi:archaeosortase/exosortase family protein [Novosphingobium nitrogenifigens]|nr:archaeosortase/exosortase family protein [Novosphingobium nitrogenifigens]